MFTAFATAIGQVRSGKLRALAVCSARRASAAPNVPAVAETISGFESSQWYGLFAPAAAPAAAIERLNAETTRLLSDATLRKQFADNSAEIVGGTPAELASALKIDYEKWGNVMMAAGLRPE